MPAPLVENAPAKVNLTLRVIGRRSDGYHDIESLVAFADFGDCLTFSRGDELKLSVHGPGAAQAGEGAAVDALMRRLEHIRAFGPYTRDEMNDR